LVLSDEDIKEFIRVGEIEIENYKVENLEPASYDFRVGDKAITEEGVIDIKKKGYIKIPRGSTAVVYPCEKVKLGQRIIGKFGLRSSLARKGLILHAGPQIDPGFSGLLSFTIYNSGTTDVILRHNESFASVEFLELKTPSSRAYSGSYQNQNGISKDDIELVTRKYKNLSEIEDFINDIRSELSSVKTFNNTVMLGIIISTFAFIFSQLFSTSSSSPLTKPVSYFSQFINVRDIAYLLVFSTIVGVFFAFGKCIGAKIIKIASLFFIRI